MSQKQTGGLGTLLLMPSFQGALAWGFWLVMYEARLLAWDPAPPLANALYVLAFSFFALSTVTWYGRYRAWGDHNAVELLQDSKTQPTAPDARRCLAVLHTLGFLGWALYTRDFATALGGLPTFAQLLLGASWMIRRQAEVTSSVGTQLSYFGWMATALTFYEYWRGRVGRPWLAVAVLQFLANFLYIARTGPTTILFTTGMLALIAVPIVKPRALALRVVGLAVVLGIIFLIIASWTGKVAQEGQYGATILPLWAQNLYFYGTGSFGYFSHLVDVQEPIAYLPDRALYPALKALAGLGIAQPPPSQINEYFSMPFTTNVGTFLEPFYRDGGLAFAFAAILVHSFGLDWLGLTLLRSGQRVALFAWANLCFVAFISFFTPKLTGFPTWLFTGLAIAAVLLTGNRRGKTLTASSVTASTGGHDAAN